MKELVLYVKSDGIVTEWKILPQIKSVIKKSGNKTEIVEWGKAIEILQKIYDHWKEGKYPKIEISGNWIDFIKLVSGEKRKLRLRGRR